MQKTVTKDYIYIHKNYLELFDALTKKDGFFSDGAHLIRFAVSIGLTVKGKLDPEIYSQLRRQDEARNFQSSFIDEDGQITFILNELSGGKLLDKYSKYTRMEELANIGLDLLQRKYIDQDSLIIDWDKIIQDLG